MKKPEIKTGSVPSFLPRRMKGMRHASSATFEGAGFRFQGHFEFRELRTLVLDLKDVV